MRSCAYVLLVAACLVSAAWLGPGAEASSAEGTCPHVYELTLKSGVVRNLSGDACDSAVAASPAGDALAVIRQVQRGDSFGYQLWTIGTDGSAARKVTPDPSADQQDPAWSADGREIAFTNVDLSSCLPQFHNCATFAVEVQRADGTGARVVGGGGEKGAWRPAWAPHARRLAFAGSLDFDEGAHSIEVVGDRGDVRPVANSAENGAIFNQPTLSPRGRWVAYVRTSRAQSSIVCRPVAGGRERRLARGRLPLWSPGGYGIAFLDPRGAVATIRADGSHRRRVAAGAAALAWSPSGRMLVLVSASVSDVQIRVAPVAGGPPRLVGTVRGSLPLSGVSVAWSPDGRAVYFTAA